MILIGDIFRDRDKRMLSGNRYCKVTHVDEKNAWMLPCHADGTVYSNRTVRVSLKRLHGQIGWQRVMP